MYTVYVLRDKTGKSYKGATKDLNRRLKEHARGSTKSTAAMLDFVVVYQEVYNTWTEARKRERYLKSAAGRRFLKKIR